MHFFNYSGVLPICHALKRGAPHWMCAMCRRVSPFDDIASRCVHACDHWHNYYIITLTFVLVILKVSDIITHPVTPEKCSHARVGPLVCVKLHQIISLWPAFRLFFRFWANIKRKHVPAVRIKRKILLGNPPVLVHPGADVFLVYPSHHLQCLYILYIIHVISMLLW